MAHGFRWNTDDADRTDSNGFLCVALCLGGSKKVISNGTRMTRIGRIKTDFFVLLFALVSKWFKKGNIKWNADDADRTDLKGFLCVPWWFNLPLLNTFSKAKLSTTLFRCVWCGFLLVYGLRIESSTPGYYQVVW